MIHRSHRRSIKSSFRDKVHYKLRNTTIITHSSYSKFIRVTTPPGFDCRCWKKYSRLHSPAFDRGPEKKIVELNSPPRFRQYTRFPSKNRLIARRFSSHDRIIRIDLFGAEISFELNFVPQRVGIVNEGRRFDRGSKFLWVNGIYHPLAWMMMDRKVPIKLWNCFERKLAWMSFESFNLGTPIRALALPYPAISKDLESDRASSIALNEKWIFFFWITISLAFEKFFKIFFSTYFLLSPCVNWIFVIKSVKFLLLILMILKD